MSVAGFDGEQFTEYLVHPLTTMKQNTTEIGISLADTLIDVIKNPSKEKRTVEFDAELIKGDTVAKI